MARILAISSQVIYGPVGNTAAVPALQAMGHEVLQVPTVLLSHHPGHGKPQGQATPVELLERMLGSVQAVGGLEDCDAVLTGYFTSAEQVEVVARLIAHIKPPVVLVDPVIGDEGKLYVVEETATAIGELLIPIATIATPNIFELAWLTRSNVTAHGEAVAAARALGPNEVIVTSVAARSEIETLLVTSTAERAHQSARREQVPNGTGDFLSGLYLAHRLTLPPFEAFTEAMRILDKAIAISAGSPVLAVAHALQK